MSADSADPRRRRQVHMLPSRPKESGCARSGSEKIQNADTFLKHAKVSSSGRKASRGSPNSAAPARHYGARSAESGAQTASHPGVLPIPVPMSDGRGHQSVDDEAGLGDTAGRSGLGRVPRETDAVPLRPVFRPSGKGGQRHPSLYPARPQEKDGPSIPFDRTTTSSPIKYTGRIMNINGQHPSLSVGLAGTIVSAYVSNNSVPASDLPDLIGDIHSALIEIFNRPAADPSITIKRKATTAQIHDSIRSDTLISFIDGKAYRMLKRHLASHGLDPKGYRERYGLPANYPMIAAGYAARRSEIAKAIGLGQARARADQRKTGPRHRR